MKIHSGQLKIKSHPRGALSRSPQALVIILTEFLWYVRFIALLPEEFIQII